MKRTMRPLWVVTTWLCIGVLVVGGCTHPMTVKNISRYRTSGISTFDHPIRIGIVADVRGDDEQAIINGVASALGGYSAQVIMPYSPTSTRPVDVIVSLGVRANRKGSGWNFLINWPGFLIFTPAWNGYVYKIDYDVHCTLTKAATKQTIDQFTIPITLDIRHAAINRTWTEISWFEWSVIAFIGGLVFINYDDHVTALVGEKIENPLGKYIAQEIVKRINSHGGLTQVIFLKEQFKLAYNARSILQGK